MDLVLGVDEAGRGSLAGPLGVAAVAFSKSFFLDLANAKVSARNVSMPSIQDSKQLSPLAREKSYSIIKKYASFVAIVYVSNRIIDRTNINLSTERAIIALIRRVQTNRNYQKLILLVDGNMRFPLIEENKFPLVKYKSIVKGDKNIFSIAAASIIAKVRRDQRISNLARYFPEYNWDKNKGYPTIEHRTQIKRLGITPLHRQSYRPCREGRSSNSNNINVLASKLKAL